MTNGLPEAAAIGAAGDVWLCHPYIVHAAPPHRGKVVRFMAQPPLPGAEPLDPARPPEELPPVERAIHDALAGQGAVVTTGSEVTASCTRAAVSTRLRPDRFAV
jgi:hypothetical protein